MEKRNVGVRVGASYSQFDARQYNNTEWQAGFAAGPFLSTAISECSSIDLSAIYTVRNGAYISEAVDPEQPPLDVNKISLSSDYIDLSILLRRAVFRQPMFAPVLIGGLSYGFVTATEYSQGEHVYLEMANHADAAVVAGVGVERVQDRLNLSVDLLYRYPIVVSGWGEPEVSGFSLLLGIGF